LLLLTKVADKEARLSSYNMGWLRSKLRKSGKIITNRPLKSRRHEHFGTWDQVVHQAVWLLIHGVRFEVCFKPSR
jgi:hypothetical protein